MDFNMDFLLFKEMLLKVFAAAFSKNLVANKFSQMRDLIIKI